MVGVPVSTADQINVYQENEELKEELQKLAEKVEFYKIRGMMSTNHHLKRRNSYFSSGYPVKQSEGLPMRRPTHNNPPLPQPAHCTLPHRESRTRSRTLTASIHRPTNTLPRTVERQYQSRQHTQDLQDAGVHGQFILCNNGGGGERMRSFSHNGMNRNGRPKSDGFSSSNTAVASYTYSCADTAAAASLTSSPSSEPLIPDKG